MIELVVAGFAAIIQGIMGVFMYFMKVAHENTKDRLTKLETDMSKTMLKEDFRDFKLELFARLDRFENELRTKRE